MEFVAIGILILIILFIFMTDYRIESDKEYYKCFAKRNHFNPGINEKTGCPGNKDNIKDCKHCRYYKTYIKENK